MSERTRWENVVDEWRTLATPRNDAERAAYDQYLTTVRHYARIMGVDLTPEVAGWALFGASLHQALLLRDGFAPSANTPDPPLRELIAALGVAQAALAHIARP